MTIELGEEELRLINTALELYVRVGLLQFEHLDMVRSLDRLVYRQDKTEEFREITDKLKELLGYSSNSSPGIFNKKDVQDDVRIAADIHQTVRHEFWKKRENRSTMTVDAYPADICRIAGIKEPKFKIIEND